MNIKLRSFAGSIAYFNGMYKLPVAPYPSLAAEAAHQAHRPGNENLMPQELIPGRLRDFQHILTEEVAEVQDIILSIEKGVRIKDGEVVLPEEPYLPIEALTDLADWLGDITVYCASEAQRFGLPMDEILKIIMQSNFSKLGSDGKPIYDSHGKVSKGPLYWKPEPQIKELLLDRIAKES